MAILWMNEMMIDWMSRYQSVLAVHQDTFSAQEGVAGKFLTSFVPDI
jgi:hypothetical protein